MKPLRKEKKVLKVDNVFQETLVNIFFAYNWSSQKIKEAIAPYNITQQQYNVLRILKDQYPSPSTVNLIKAKIIDKMSDVSRIVDRLIQKELLEKRENNYDKRAVDIVISEKGLMLMKKMDKNIDFSKAFESCISEEEAITLNALLSKLKG